MKKCVSVFCAALIASSVFVPVNAADEVKVELDGRTLKFDVPPQIIEGRTLVPLRVIFEELGASVDWNGDTRTVTAGKGGTEVSMAIGNNVMTVNSKSITLDVPPQIIEDRTLVPARAVAESFGAVVDWNGDTRTVIISTVTASEPVDKPKEAAPVKETPSPTEAPKSGGAFPIEYDDTSDLVSEIVSNFKILNVVQTESGDYKVDFMIETFLESTGKASTRFACLDENGKQVDSWERIYDSTAYTPTLHKDSVTISGKTRTIFCESK